MTGAESKKLWSTMDFQVNERGHIYANGSNRGESGDPFSDSPAQFNIDTVQSYEAHSGGLFYLVSHELGHRTDAGWSYNQSMGSGGVTDAENIENEQIASNVARAIANYGNEPVHWGARYGYDGGDFWVM